MENLKFVFLHSAYPLYFGLGFLLLGFLYGYFHWARWVRQVRGLKAEANDLERGIKPRNVQLGATPDYERSSTRNQTLPKVAATGAGLAGLGALAHKFQGEEDKIEIDNDLGVVYKQRPDEVDDLTELDGIDAKTAERLNDNGIYTFKQLEALDDNQRDRLASRFNLPKIDWDSWTKKLGWGALGAGGLVGISSLGKDASEDDLSYAPPTESDEEEFRFNDISFD